MTSTFNLDDPDFVHEFSIDYDEPTYYQITETKPRAGWIAKLARFFHLPYGWETTYEIGEGRITSLKVSPKTSEYSVVVLMRQSDAPALPEEWKG